jgi:plastocyanin
VNSSFGLSSRLSRARAVGAGFAGAVALMGIGGVAVAADGRGSAGPAGPVRTAPGPATVRVTITPGGYVPADVTIHAGDSIAFTNSDAVAHQFRPDSTSNVICSGDRLAGSLAIRPGETVTCTFPLSQRFPYRDPGTPDARFRGTITVRPARVTIVRVSPRVVTYGPGGEASVVGVLSSRNSDVPMSLWEKPFGRRTYRQIASEFRTAEGYFGEIVTPRIRTTYQIRARERSGATSFSAPVTINVAPFILLRRSSYPPGSFEIMVVSQKSHRGKYVLIQRRNRSGRWVPIRRTRINWVTRVHNLRLPRGVNRLRAYLPTSQAARGYVGGTSNTFVVRR